MATAAGQILSYDTSTDGLISTINFTSRLLTASASGAVIAAVAPSSGLINGPSSVLNVYSLPSGNALYNLLYEYYVLSNLPPPLALSAAGDAILAPLDDPSANASPGCILQFLTLAGAPSFCYKDFGDVALSPDETLVSIGDAVSGSSNIYKNGSLLTAVPAVGVAWLDNATLYANTFTRSSTQTLYTGTVLYDGSGNVLNKLSLPQIDALAVVTPTKVYAPALNAIYSVTSGAEIWASANAPRQICANGCSGFGVVAGPNIVFTSGHFVLSEPYPMP